MADVADDLARHNKLSDTEHPAIEELILIVSTNCQPVARVIYSAGGKSAKFLPVISANFNPARFCLTLPWLFPIMALHFK